MGDWRVDVSAADPDIGEEMHAEIADVVRSVLAAEGAGAAEVSIALLPDAEIAAMNAQYLSHDGPTDVISFPLEQPGAPLVGDVYIGAEQAARQAGEHGATPREELLRLAIHGTLHVLGWEHPEGDDRADSEMYRRQEELLAAFLGGV